MAKLNLDALISREDFEVKDGAVAIKQMQTVSISELEDEKLFQLLLRKPDFQRETSEWNHDKIIEFITSFLDGDLIPSIILWKSDNFIFVIDGAHRLSALLSWVQDDYGDGFKSKSFFSHSISNDQLKAADRARNQIKRTIGSYKDLQSAVKDPLNADSIMLARAKRMASLAIDIQWVTGDAEKAEASFFKINREASPINPTELKLLQSRKKPNAMAARAIIRSGTGHKYWSGFDVSKQDEIEEFAKELHSILFAPELKTPIKTLDLPVAGKGYSAKTLALIFDLVNVINDVDEDTELDDDKVGTSTIDFLSATQKIVRRIAGVNPSSLGLHPVVYFYSADGRYQPTAFFTAIEFIRTLEKNNQLNLLIDNRRRFEDFLLKHKKFVNQISQKFGSGLKSYKRVEEYYRTLLELIDKGIDEENLLINILSKFPYLNPDEIEINEESDSNDFSTSTKSATFLREAVQNPIRCSICGGMIHPNSTTFDHKIRKEDAGTSTPDNAQLAHPYCNSTYKN